MPSNHAQNSGQNPIQQEKTNPDKISRNHLKTKVLFGLFLFIGFFGLIFFALNFYGNVRIDSGSAKRQVEKEQAQKEAWQELVAMQSRDTDGDGLTDYDEEYVYGTSAYLNDTDSDGYSDKTEIETNNDPLCPAGRDCEIVTEEREEIVEFEQPDFNEGYEDITTYTPSEIRQMLIEDGFSEEEVNALSDEDINQIMNEIQAEDLGDQGVGSPSESSQEISEDLSANEIRQMMLETGSISEEQLNTLSDDDLLDLYKEAYQETKTNE